MLARASRPAAYYANRDELLRWIRSGPELPRAVFVVHGEPEAAQALARRARRDLGLRSHVPGLDEGYDLEALL